MKKTGLFIGRFQPFHNGHLATVKFALRKVDTLVIVVGSAQKSHDERNPFTAGERIRMIRKALEDDRGIDAGRILIIPVPDIGVHSLWTRQVDMLVPKYDLVIANDSFTIMLFRERGVKVIEPPLHRRSEISGTEIRKKMAISDPSWSSLVPAAVKKIVDEIDGVGRVKSIADRRDQDQLQG